MKQAGPKWLFNPFASSAVGNPRQSPEPDVKSINRKAFDGLMALLPQLNDKTKNLAALVLGEAGTGKTHLIKRLFSSPGLDIVFVYLHPMKDPRTIFSSLLGTVITDLSSVPPSSEAGSKATQLDLIVANVVFAAFRDYVKRHPTEHLKGLVEKFGAKPLRVLNLKKAADWPKLLKKAKDFLEKAAGLGGAASRIIVDVLFQYLEESKKSAVRKYLSGLLPDEGECQALGLTLTEADFSIEAQENRSCEILHTLGKLLGFYRPMILCFDQLENLDNEQLVKGFGKLVLHLVDSTDNVLPIGFIRPETWENYLSRHLAPAATGRLSSNQFFLQGCNLDQALEIVLARLAWAYEDVSEPRPDAFFPFDKRTLEQELKGQAFTPREVIFSANKLLGAVPKIEAPLKVLLESFKAEREKLLMGDDKEPTRKETIVAALRLYFANRGDRGAYQADALPDSMKADLALRISPKAKGQSSKTVLIAVETSVHWKPLGAAFDNLGDRMRDGTADCAFFIRDLRFPIPPKKGGMPKTVERKQAFKHAGGTVLYLDYPSLADLYALVYSDDKIGSGDVSYVASTSGERKPISKATCEQFIRDRFQSAFLQEMESVFLAGSPRQVSGGEPPPWTREEEGTVFKALVGVLNTAPFKYDLERIAKKLHDKPGLPKMSRDHLAVLIGKHRDTIDQVTTAPPIYFLKTR